MAEVSKYRPTRVDAPIEDIYKMADGQNKSHSICNMCPANPKWFRAHKQLTDVKKVVPRAKSTFSFKNTGKKIPAKIYTIGFYAEV